MGDADREAIVFAWALRALPYVRWLGLLANTMMLIFTPLHGSHYLVDVIAGVALALAIPASQWLMRTTAGPSAREAIVSRLVPSPELK